MESFQSYQLFKYVMYILKRAKKFDIAGEIRGRDGLLTYY